ncbi:CaiB/BaiF CoA transferase family protein [Dietzia sp. NPDC055343]
MWSNNSNSALPLSGVKVLEFGHVAAGPFTCDLLAKLGAEVIKIEPPAGDQMRSWPPRANNGEGYSLNFASVNIGKQSLFADLKDHTEWADVAELADSADVIVSNYRPDVLAKLGFGFETLRERRKKSPFVFAEISGFGSTSPFAHVGAFDVVIQGMTGLMSVTGEKDGPPAKCGVPVADFVTGLYTAMSIIAWLPVAVRESRGVHLEASMFDCVMAISALQTSEYWGSGRDPIALGTAHPRNAPYQAFHASDGWFTVAAGNDKLWRSMREAIGLQALLDPRFDTQRGRVENQLELESILQARFVGDSQDHWLNLLRDAGVPCGPVSPFSEALASEHVRATGLLDVVDVDDFGPMPFVRYPVRVDEKHLDLPGRPPSNSKEEVNANQPAGTN